MNNFVIIYKPTDQRKLYLAVSIEGEYWWDNGSNKDNILKFNNFSEADNYININLGKIPMKDESKLEIENIKDSPLNQPEKESKSFIPLSDKITFESVKNMIHSIISENKLSEEEIEEMSSFGGTTTADLGPAIQYVGDRDESMEESDEIDEMARGVLTPQETVKRQYAQEFPEMNIKTSDQFLRKVILDDGAPGHTKYVQMFADELNKANTGTWSDVAGEVFIDLGVEDGDNESLVKNYAISLLGHRKDMSKANYVTHGDINAYGRPVLKHGPYRPRIKPYQEPEVQIGKDYGIEISNEYNNVDPSQSNQVLKNMLQDNKFNSLDQRAQLNTLRTIEDMADLDVKGEEIIKKIKDYIISQISGDE